jgi:hypothetical protein
MSESESSFGKGEVRKDDPPKDVKENTAKRLGSTAIGGANNTRTSSFRAALDTDRVIGVPASHGMMSSRRQSPTRLNRLAMRP